MSWENMEFSFDGPGLTPPDHVRLSKQLRRIFGLMQDGKARTLAEIAEATGDPPASVSARLRDFRKPKFGAHTVLARNMGGGLFLYAFTPNQSVTIH